MTNVCVAAISSNFAIIHNSLFYRIHNLCVDEICLNEIATFDKVKVNLLYK